jgi:hypothetical protein
MTWIGPTEACQRLGISRQMLQKKLGALADEGQARRDGARWKLRAEGLEVVYDNLTRSRADSPRAGKREKDAGVVQLPIADERSGLKAQIDALADEQSMPRHEAERQIKVLQRRLLELDLAEREGQLVEAQKERAAGFEEARRWRDLLLGIPVRIAADLAAESDPAAVSIILERALVEALTGLADGTP